MNLLKINAIKNKDDLYEAMFDPKFVESVILFDDNYIPKEVAIVPNKDIYKVLLTKGFQGELVVKNENDIPIAGVKCNYYINNIKKEAITNEKGVAFLTGLEANVLIFIDINHNGYNWVGEKWSIVSAQENSKKIILQRLIGISGKVKFGNFIVKDARIFLRVANGNISRSSTAISDEKGHYDCFIAKGNYDSVVINAFHPDYGLSPFYNVKWEEKQQEMDLILFKENNRTVVKLVDEFNLPLPNKKITLALYHRNISKITSEVMLTDEKGECEFLNLLLGDYLFYLEDEGYFLKDEFTLFELPQDEVIVKAFQRDLRKITIYDPDKKIYYGVFYCFIEKNNYGHALEIVIDKGGDPYLNFNN